MDQDWGFTVSDIATIFDETLSDDAKSILMDDPERDEKFIVNPTYSHFSDRWDAEIRSNIYSRDDLRASIGLASRQDSLRSLLFLSNTDTQKVKQASNRVYANIEWTASDKLTLNYGQVIEQRKNKASTNSLRIAANYAPSRQHIFRVASSHSYREPTLLEENQYSAYYYDTNIMAVNVKADEEIEKERLISREIGYLGSFLGSNLSLDVRIFEERLSDLIGERREPYESPTQSKVNVLDNISENFDLKGLEWQLQYKPSNRFLVNLNHSYLHSSGDVIFRTYEAEDPELDDVLCELENYDEICDLSSVVPRNMANLLISYKTIGGIKLSGSYHYKSGINEGYRHISPLPSISRIDFKASKRWHDVNHWLELSLTLQNLGDDYIEYNEFHNFGSKYVIALKMGSK